MRQDGHEYEERFIEEVVTAVTGYYTMEYRQTYGIGLLPRDDLLQAQLDAPDPNDEIVAALDGAERDAWQGSYLRCERQSRDGAEAAAREALFPPAASLEARSRSTSI